MNGTTSTNSSNCNNNNNSYVFLNSAFSAIDKTIVNNLFEHVNTNNKILNSTNYNSLLYAKANIINNTSINYDNKMTISNNISVPQQNDTIFQPNTSNQNYGTTVISKQSKRSSVSSSNSYQSNQLFSPKSISKKINNEKLDMRKKIELTHNTFEDSNLVLNCVQLINYLEFYFNTDQESSNSEQDNKTIILNDDNEEESNSSLFLDEKNLISVAYPCIGCSTKFKYQQTFHAHLNRRTVSIRIFCVKCGISKIFYNKCKLMYHIYWHKMNIFEPMFHSIKIEPITVDKLNLSKDIVAIDFDSLIAKPSFHIKDNDIMQTKFFLKKMLLNKFLLYKCFICDALFFDLNELKQHYLKSQKMDMFMINGITTSKNSFANNNNTNNDNNNSNIGNNGSKFSSVRNKYKILKEISLELFNKNNKIKGSNSSNFISSFLNNISCRKLQYTTRCSMLASLNLINQNFDLYPDFNKINNQNTHHNSNNNNNNNNNNNIDSLRVLICPECGLTFDAKHEIDNFRLHLIHECFFTAKYDWTQIKCPANNCNVICYSLQETVAHWSNAHMMKQSYCELCFKKGIRLRFETSKPSTESNNSFLLRQILSTNEYTADINHSSYLTNFLNINEINRHFFENHRNKTVSLKLDYKCLCNSLTNLVDINSEQNANTMDLQLNNENQECLFNQWRDCRKHIISILARSINSINCLLCNKLISNDKYSQHLKQCHNLDKITICPKCGPLKSNEVSLHEHFLKFHNKDLYQYSKSSCYFRTLKTSSSNNNNIYQLASGFKIYQCVNCRLLFTSETNFLHNCWNTTFENNGKEGAKSNYLSPIYLDFNVNRLFEARLAKLKNCASIIFNHDNDSNNFDKQPNIRTLSNNNSNNDDNNDDDVQMIEHNNSINNPINYLGESNGLQMNKKIKITDGMII